MALQFGKLIALSTLFCSISYACCCDIIINSELNITKNYINNQHLYIVNNYLDVINNDLSSIVSNVQSTNENIKTFMNVEYNTKKQNGILLKLKQYDFILDKIDKLDTY